MSDPILLWSKVVDDRALLERAAGVDPSDVAAVTAMRRDYDVQAVSAALSLTAARSKAVDKFGLVGAELIADVPGIEQASGESVASYKAKRIHEALGEAGRVADLCCGIGGDSMALCQAGLAVVSVDRDPLRAWMAHRNTAGRSAAVCADVGSLALNGMGIHIDPARRSEASGRRAWRLADYQPGPELVGRLIEQSPAVALKLSPGVDLEELPWPGEVEFVSERGRLVQAVLWTGELQRGERRATRIDGRGTHTLAGSPTSMPLNDAGRYLYTFDASVERAGLIGLLCEQVGAPAIHPRLGLLTSDRVIDSPWLTGFELIEQLPWRPKRVKQWLAAKDGGLVEVKTRDKACDPDIEQKRLRGKGETTYTVFVLRFDTKVVAMIARRI